MDNATNEHYSMFFCAEEGTQSSFQGVRDVWDDPGLRLRLEAALSACSAPTRIAWSKNWQRPASTDMEEANAYLAETYLPACNAEFTQPPPEAGSACVARRDLSVLDDILCERFERTVKKNNCVHFEGLVLQIPADRHRCHYVKAQVKFITIPRSWQGMTPTDG